MLTCAWLLLLVVGPAKASAAEPTAAGPGKGEVQAECPDHGAPTAKPQASEGHGKVIQRGQPVSGAPEVPLQKLLASPESYVGKQVLVTGTVRRACERRGCWMELTDAGGSRAVRVTFKDYAFFVPTTSAGAKARVVGEPKLVRLTEGMAAHYQSEGGSTPAPNSPEVQFVASGVELTR